METRINVTPANIPRGLSFSPRLTADNSLAGINIWPQSLQKAVFVGLGFPQCWQRIMGDWIWRPSSSTR